MSFFGLFDADFSNFETKTFPFNLENPLRTTPNQVDFKTKVIKIIIVSKKMVNFLQDFLVKLLFSYFVLL